ncbi:hypothetical protein [Kineothrix sedimenti]|uniref:Uncharacterized protein n=1 Tax=Kineothrix sedimenti TaxID=3123317 RepID=A0ABZ3F252_9FIRM
MEQEYLDKLNEWYGDTLQRYEVLKLTENDALLFVAYREKVDNKLIFEIARVFMIGDIVQISIDETADDGFNMSSVIRLIKGVIRVI